MRAPSRIFLVGMMGCGKSAVGRELARRIGWGFIDTDALVEALSGYTVSELFKLQGEEAFRSEESRALRLAAARKSVVVATGGGAVLREHNRSLMRKTGWVTYLEADPVVLAQRVTSRRGSKRPLLDGRDPVKALRDLLKARQAFYQDAAHAMVPALGSVKQVAEAVQAAWPKD